MRKINQMLIDTIIVVSFLFSLCVISSLQENLKYGHTEPIYAFVPPKKINLSDKINNDKVVSENKEIEEILWKDSFTKYFGDVR